MNKINTLAYNKDIITSRTFNAAIGVIFFVLATILGAYVRIPINGSPVPITLQTFFVLLAGAVLGRKLASFSQLGYIILGAAGLPVFQGSSAGFLHILGPTGGYLAGFLVAAYLVGRMIEWRSSDIKWVIFSFAIGDIIIHAFGTLWLSFLCRIDIVNAFSMGFLPFIPGDVFKILAAAMIYSGISRRVKDIFQV